MKLTLDIFGEEQIGRELLRYSEYVGSPRPAFHQIAEDMRAQIAEQFATEGGRGSGGWAPLQATTIAAKAAAGLDPHILQATHDLINSLIRPGGEHIEEVGDSFLEFGSSNPYGKYHQKGTSRLPVRKPVDFTELDRRGFIRTLQRYFAEGTT